MAAVTAFGVSILERCRALVEGFLVQQDSPVRSIEVKLIYPTGIQVGFAEWRAQEGQDLGALAERIAGTS